MILVYIYPLIFFYALLMACAIALHVQYRREVREWNKFEEWLMAFWEPIPQTRESRLEEIERRRDSVLAECNPNLPTYEAK